MTTPAGSLALSKAALARTLADCPTFRTWTSTLTHAQAQAKIYPEGLPEPANKNEYTLAEITGYRPYAMLFMADAMGFSIDVGPVPTASGVLKIALEENVDSAVGSDPSSAANASFENTLSQIIDELADRSGLGELNQYLDIHRITVESGPYWSRGEDRDASGFYIGATLSITRGGM